jgi:pimeloyl-ACP methyl ester carboxylesterase
VKKTSIILVVFILLTSIASVAAQDGQVEILDECFTEVAAPEGISYECGYLTVPEFHGVDNGRTVKTAFVRLLSLSDNPGTPLFKTHGGPGGNELQTLAFEQFLALDSYLLESRDMVLINQRGSIYGDPYLTCGEEFAAAEQQVVAEQLRFEERRTVLNASIQACYDKFIAEGIDLTAFNSVENAADINTLAQALGYEKIFYHGSSYGTILGQHMIREYPDLLEGVILDGSTGLGYQESWVEYNAAGRAEFWDRFFAECAEVEACATRFPDIESDMETMLAKFAETPYVYDTGTYQVLIDDIRLENGLLGFATNTPGSQFAEQIPAFINLFATTDDEALIDSLMTSLFSGQFESFGGGATAYMSHFAFTCSEDRVNGIDDVITEGVPTYGTTFGIDDAEQYVFACALVDVPSLPDEARVNVPTDIPILFINGQLDANTLFSWNEALMDFYDHEYAYTFPLSGHVQYNKLPLQPCASDILTQFLNDPAAAPDGSCIEAFPESFEWIIPQ